MLAKLQKNGAIESLHRHFKKNINYLIKKIHKPVKSIEKNRFFPFDSFPDFQRMIKTRNIILPFRKN